MSNRTPAMSSTQQISPADRLALARALNSLVGDELSQTLPVDLRQRLEHFVVATDDLMQPATAPQIETEIAILMMAFYSARSTSKSEASAMLRVYGEVLSGLPLWAIRHGFAKIRSGAVDGLSLDFPPAAPRLRQVVAEAMQSLLSDRHSISKVLTAREALPVDPEKAAQVKQLIYEGLKKLSIQIQAHTDAGYPAPTMTHSERKAPTPDQLYEIYKTRSLPDIRSSK